ncbi:MAG: hypothetical protein ACYC4P_11630 [Thermoanaerobaculia bacterium]
MATLSDLIVRLQQVGEEMRAVASDAREAAEEVESLGRVEAETISGATSGLPRAGNASAGTMGAATGASGVTTQGLTAALQITRGRLGK